MYRHEAPDNIQLLLDTLSFLLMTHEHSSNINKLYETRHSTFN